jgi:hypothetical protein
MMCQKALGVLVPIPDFLWPHVHFDFALTHPEFGIDEQGRRCLAVDECMVPALLALWEHEIPTISACCLHGTGEGVITLPRVVEPGAVHPKPNWLLRDEAVAELAELCLRAEAAERDLAQERATSQALRDALEHSEITLSYLMSHVRLPDLKVVVEELKRAREALASAPSPAVERGELTPYPWLEGWQGPWPDGEPHHCPRCSIGKIGHDESRGYYCRNCGLEMAAVPAPTASQGEAAGERA